LEVMRLALALQSGELAATSRDAKRIVFAWCARITAPQDVTSADDFLSRANQLGDGEENRIAAIFIGFFRGHDRAAALAGLVESNTSVSRSASLLIAANGVTPEECCAWFDQTGWGIANLDADGKLNLLNLRIRSRQWEQSEAEVELVTEGDFL